MPSLEKMIEDTPDIKIDEEVSRFLEWLDTSDHWGWELQGTMHHKIKNTFPPKLKEIQKDPVKLQIYNFLKSLPYEKLDIIIVNWIGKEEILRSLERW